MNQALLVISVLLGVMAWGIILGRVYCSWNAREASGWAIPHISSSLLDGRIDEAIKTSESWKNSPVATVTAAGLMTFRDDLGNVSNAAVVNRVERAMTRATNFTMTRLRGPIAYLETIGAVSPTIAFIYNHQAAIYLALFVTAPSVAYGILYRNKLSAFETEMLGVASEVLDYIERSLNKQAP